MCDVLVTNLKKRRELVRNGRREHESGTVDLFQPFVNSMPRELRPGELRIVHRVDNHCQNPQLPPGREPAMPINVSVAILIPQMLLPLPGIINFVEQRNPSL